MIYKVKAKFNFKKAEEFLEELTNGNILNQKPDGREIVNSMRRATIDKDGYINWTEICFCPTPLQHERATVYDHFFTELETESIGSHQIYEGESFINQLSTPGPSER